MAARARQLTTVALPAWLLMSCAADTASDRFQYVSLCASVRPLLDSMRKKYWPLDEDKILMVIHRPPFYSMGGGDCRRQTDGALGAGQPVARHADGQPSHHQI